MLKQVIAKLPGIGALVARWRTARFRGSEDYWEQRYASGRDSGDGSRGELARIKARNLNELVSRHGIRSVVEWGCGDGRQLALGDYPEYLGIDVSPTAIRQCRARFCNDEHKTFMTEVEWLSQPPRNARFDLAISLDVIYHLVEDPVYLTYMTRLFDSAARFVVIYSSNTNDPTFNSAHVVHRRFTDWVEANATEWTLAEKLDNEYPYDPSLGSGSLADFYVFTSASI